MSIAAINWVFCQLIKPAWLKFLLVALADNANDLAEAWPSIPKICKKTSLNRKTVIKGLAELEGLGLIKDTGRRTGRTNSIPIYRLVGMIEKQSRARNDSTDGTVPPIPQAVPSVAIEPSRTVNNCLSRRKANSVDEVKEYAKQIGVSDSDAEGFYDSQEAGGWTRSGQPVKDWKATLRTWKRYGYLASQKQRSSNSAAHAKLAPRIEKGMGWS